MKVFIKGYYYSTGSGFYVGNNIGFQRSKEESIGVTTLDIRNQHPDATNIVVTATDLQDYLEHMKVNDLNRVAGMIEAELDRRKTEE